MRAHATDSATLKRLGGDVIHAANRSIQLLNAIETTVSALCYDRSFYSAIANFSHKMTEAIKKSESSEEIYSDETHLDGLLKAQEKIHNLYDLMIAKRHSAISDPRLTDEDGVANEYTETIAVIAELHNNLNDLRWAIGEHNARISGEGRGEILRSPKDVEKYLDTL